MNLGRAAVEARAAEAGVTVTDEGEILRFIVPGREGSVVVGLDDGVLRFFPARSSGQKAVLGVLGYLD